MRCSSGDCAHQCSCDGFCETCHEVALRAINTIKTLRMEFFAPANGADIETTNAIWHSRMLSSVEQKALWEALGFAVDALERDLAQQ